MTIKCWLIIKDDSKKTFEVIGQATNDNAFFNKTYAMQKAGMNVSCVTPPVSGKNSNREAIKFVGYTKEDGLNERLLKTYREITLRSSEQWE